MGTQMKARARGCPIVEQEAAVIANIGTSRLKVVREENEVEHAGLTQW